MVAKRLWRGSMALATLLTVGILVSESQAQVTAPGGGLQGIPNPFGAPGAVPGTGTPTISQGVRGGNGGFTGYGGFPVGPGWWGGPWSSPIGSVYFGTAEILRAGSEVRLNNEYQRYYRELNTRARYVTRKEKEQLRKWLLDNGVTKVDIRLKQAEERLRAIRKLATLGEIRNGAALNELLKANAKKIHTNAVPQDVALSGDILTRLNVTTGANGSLALLRNDGKVNWPDGLVSVTTADQRKNIDYQAEALYTKILKGEPASSMKTIRDNLLKDIDAMEQEFQKEAQTFLEGKILGGADYSRVRTFIRSFRSAIRASRTEGLGKQIAAFQTQFKDGGKVGDVVRYMSKNGLQFAAATDGDIGAYQAMYNGLATVDLQMLDMSAKSSSQQ
ncbi:MAG: hypothetical protein ACFCD0_13965 [Gemmataceae bacterium]